MEEGSHPHFDNLLCEISPPFSQKRLWKLDSNLFCLSVEDLWWEAEESLENLILHWEFLSLNRFTPSPVISLIKIKLELLQENTSLLFKGYRSFFHSTFHVLSVPRFGPTCPNYQMLLQPVPFAAPILALSLKPSKKPHTHTKNPLCFVQFCSKQLLLLTVVMGPSSLTFPMPDPISVFWRNYSNSLPNEWSSWLNIPRCWILMQQREKAHLWVWYQHQGRKCHLVWSVPMALCLGNQAGHCKKDDYFKLTSFLCSP